MVFILKMVLFARGVHLCMIEEKDTNMFVEVEEIFSTTVDNQLSMERYISDLETWKLERYKKFCHCKENKEVTNFCKIILKRFYNLNHSSKLATKTSTQTQKVKRQILDTSGLREAHRSDHMITFLTDLVHELRVQYVVIILEDSQYTSEKKILMKEIFKTFSKLSIRLSVELVQSNFDNITAVVPVTSSDRPCMFFLMGETAGIMQKVRAYQL